MKKVLRRLLPVMILLMTAIALTGDQPWFDMENCAFCRQLTKDPLLLDNMTWELHEISNGVLTVTMVEPEFRASYVEAQKEMKRVGDELAQGKQDIHMCGHCETYGRLMMSGAKTEHVSTSMGDISLITSDKPELIAMIKQYGKRTMEELAKMDQTQKTEKKE